MVVLPLLYKSHAYTVAGGHGEHNVQRKKGLPGLTERGQHPAGRLSPALFQTLPDVSSVIVLQKEKTCLRLFLFGEHRLEIGKGIVGGCPHIILRILASHNGGAVLIGFRIL